MFLKSVLIRVLGNHDKMASCHGYLTPFRVHGGLGGIPPQAPFDAGKLQQKELAEKTFLVFSVHGETQVSTPLYSYFTP